MNGYYCSWGSKRKRKRKRKKFLKKMWPTLNEDLKLIGWLAHVQIKSSVATNWENEGTWRILELWLAHSTVDFILIRCHWMHAAVGAAYQSGEIRHLCATSNLFLSSSSFFLSFFLSFFFSFFTDIELLVVDDTRTVFLFLIGWWPPSLHD